MELATNPLDVRVNKRELILHYKDIDGATEIIDEFFDQNDISIFNHLHFGYWFSSLLHENYRTEDYRKVIDKYNELTQDKFSETIDYVNNLFTQVALKINSLAIINTPKFYIEDQTDITGDRCFKSESDLEYNMYNFLKQWSSKWVVKRQQQVGFGKCDIVIESEAEKVAIELKKGPAQRKDVYQAVEYSKENTGYKPILVANSFDQDVIKLAKELNLNCYEYALARIEGFSVPYNFYLFPAYEFARKTYIDKEFEEINQCDGFLIDYDKIPPSVDAHKIVNNEINKLINAINSLVEYGQIEYGQTKATKHICPVCNTELFI